MDTEALESLNPGQKIRIIQTVRVGRKSWPVTVSGTLRDVGVLQTGLATERAADDVVTIRTIHFQKDNGELSSVAVDENTKIELFD